MVLPVFVGEVVNITVELFSAVVILVVLSVIFSVGLFLVGINECDSFLAGVAEVNPEECFHTTLKFYFEKSMALNALTLKLAALYITSYHNGMCANFSVGSVYKSGRSRRI